MRSRAERIVAREWSSASASLSSVLRRTRSGLSNPLASVHTPRLRLSRRAAKMAVVRTSFAALTRPSLALSAGRCGQEPPPWHTCAGST